LEASLYNILAQNLKNKNIFKINSNTPFSTSEHSIQNQYLSTYHYVLFNNLLPYSSQKQSEEEYEHPLTKEKSFITVISQAQHIWQIRFVQ
jgi:hypothetical protein